MANMIRTPSSPGIKIENSIVEEYYANSGEIKPGTFVEFVNNIRSSDTTFPYQHVRFLRLSEKKYVCFGTNFEDKIYFRVIDCSGSSLLITPSDKFFSVSSKTDETKTIFGKLDENTFFTLGTNKILTYTVSGVELTLNTEIPLTHDYFDGCLISSNIIFALTYTNYTGVYATLIDLSTGSVLSDTLIKSSNNTFSAGAICHLQNGEILVKFYISNTLYVYYINVNGDSVNITSIDSYGSYSSYPSDFVKLSNSMVVMPFDQSSSTDYLKLLPLKISNGSCTAGTIVQSSIEDSGSPGYWNIVNSQNSFALCCNGAPKYYFGSDSFNKFVICYVDPNGDISILYSNISNAEKEICRVNDKNFIVAELYKKGSSGSYKYDVKFTHIVLSDDYSSHTTTTYYKTVNETTSSLVFITPLTNNSFVVRFGGYGFLGKIVSGTLSFGNLIEIPSILSTQSSRVICIKKSDTEVILHTWWDGNALARDFEFISVSGEDLTRIDYQEGYVESIGITPEGIGFAFTTTGTKCFDIKSVTKSESTINGLTKSLTTSTKKGSVFVLNQEV